MKFIFFLSFLLPFMVQAQVFETPNCTIIKKQYKIFYSRNDSTINRMQHYVESGILHASTSLNRKFKKKVGVYLFPDRSSLDKQWQLAWKMPSFNSECWMVGSGVESRLDLLSPIAWDTQACDHDANNATEIKLLIYHELVHILHSDYNRSPSFENINNIDWFVEGLAVFISGQLDEARQNRTTEYIKEAGGPDQLSKFWKGAHKYGLSGSMVAYIDKNYGREMLSSLMEFNDVEDILIKLKISEQELIANWKQDLLK